MNGASQHKINQGIKAGNTIFNYVFILVCLLATVSLSAQVKQLKVSANKRFFQTIDDKPFFWIGDTGWLLFVKCNREDAIHYLETRKQQGFNVVQVMVLHDMNNTKNVHKHNFCSDSRLPIIHRQFVFRECNS